MTPVTVSSRAVSVKSVPSVTRQVTAGATPDQSAAGVKT